MTALVNQPRVITLPDDSEVETDALDLDLGFGVLTVHANKAEIRTIERWRTKEVHEAIREVWAEGCQEIENALWQILQSRFVDDAFGASLVLLGKIVGEPQNNRPDPSYRVRIKARIRINQSAGGAPDILAVAKLLEPANAFIYTPSPPASFVLAMVNPPSGFATASEFAGLIGEATAAGIGGFVVMPTDVDGFVLGDATGSIDTADLGDSTGSLDTAPLPDGRLT